MQLFSAAPEPPPTNANFILALKLHPIERIVAVLAWWREDAVVKFQIARKPGLLANDAAATLVPAMEAMPGFGAENLKYAQLLAENQEVAPWLARRGYQPQHTEHIFELPLSTAFDRVGALLARYSTEMPGSWTTEPIRLHSPEVVWPLIAPFRLIRFESLQSLWSAPGERGFHPELSNILFDAGTPLGVLLVRTDHDHLVIDIRVVKPMALQLRSLANLAFFGHWRLVTPTTWRVIRFRGDEVEHRETANLARRMGGRQVAVRHIYTRHGSSPGP